MSIPDALAKSMDPAVPHGSWFVMDVKKNQLVYRSEGVGVDALREELPDDDCCYCVLTLRVTLQEVPDQPRRIFIQWRGPAASGMKKVKANQLFQQALDLCSPTHAQLEAVGKTEFTEEIISQKWLPEAGSHVIN